MSGRLAAVAALIILTACPVLACEGRNLDPNDLVENPVTWSANGRFCVIVRWHRTIADFTTERVGTVYGLDNPEPLTESEVEPPPPSPAVPAVLYESRGPARVPVAEIALNGIDASSELFVSNSGRYVVAFHRLGMGGCSGQSLPDDRFLAIYRIGAAQVVAWNVGDVLGDYDIVQLFGKSVEVELRNESDDREIAALRIPANRNGEQSRIEERRVDLNTARLLDPKKDIYPTPRAFAAIAGSGRHADGPMRDCSALAVNPIRLTSQQLLARATRGPLPQFPSIAYKVRLRGIVTTELLISEQGDVLCVRSSNLPFGLTTAAEESARRWKFKPYVIDGRPMPIIGEIAFHFEDVDAETWASITRGLPPSD
jgi:hypothetical protein